MISELKRCCTTYLSVLLAIPCVCCMVFTGLIAGFENGRDAASSILDFDFDGELVEIEFVDEPPIAPAPGGASEWSTWVVLELGGAQAREFEQMIETSTEWQEMPLPEELLEHGILFQPPETIEGKEIREKLPLANRQGYYLFDGDIESLRFHIAIYDPESKRLYIRAVSY